MLTVINVVLFLQFRHSPRCDTRMETINNEVKDSGKERRSRAGGAHCYTLHRESIIHVMKW